MILRFVFLFIFLTTNVSVACPLPQNPLQERIDAVMSGLLYDGKQLKIPAENLPLLENPVYIITYLAKNKEGLPHIALFATTPEKQCHFSFGGGGLGSFVADYRQYLMNPKTRRYGYKQFVFPLFGISSHTVIDKFASCLSLYKVVARMTGAKIPQIHSDKNTKFHLLGYMEKEDGVYNNCSSFIATLLDMCIDQRSCFSPEFLSAIARDNIKVVEPEYFNSMFVIESLRRLYGIPTFAKAKELFNQYLIPFILLHNVVPLRSLDTIPHLIFSNPIDQIDRDLKQIINLDYGFILYDTLIHPLSTFSKLSQLKSDAYGAIIRDNLKRLILKIIKPMEIWDDVTKPRHIFTTLDQLRSEVMKELRAKYEEDEGFMELRTSTPLEVECITHIISQLPKYSNIKLRARKIIQKIYYILDGIGDDYGTAEENSQLLQALCDKEKINEPDLVIWVNQKLKLITNAYDDVEIIIK